MKNANTKTNSPILKIPDNYKYDGAPKSVPPDISACTCKGGCKDGGRCCGKCHGGHES